MAFRQNAPAESDLLCESCGYILNGLDATAATNCPECGEPLSLSLDPNLRQPAPIEAGSSSSLFWKTTGLVLFRKRKFFRETRARSGDHLRVARFGQRHRLLAAILFGIAAATHLIFSLDNQGWVDRWDWKWVAFVIVAGGLFAGIAFGLLNFITWVASRATAVESKFWGMRLSSDMLNRAMNFHAANYLPVGVLAVVVTVGYQLALLTNVLSPAWGVTYLFVLSGAVVLGAIWLFESFVIAMRRIRFANY